MKISLSHVSKYYQDGDKSTRGLEDVSLTFQTDSSFVVITGESGAGKSTLFRVLTGTEDFDEGEITFDDRPLSGVSEEERARLYRENIAFDFQEYNLIEGFSPIENIVLSLTKSGYGLDEAKKKANQVLDEVGLNKQKRMRVSKLSGGERQRVAIARCLASDAKVLLFDEPTGNLDPSTSKEIIQLIESLQENRLILYITHDFDLVRDKATRHIVLSDGRVVSDEILTTGKPTQEKEETIEKHPTKVKSTLYTSFLFSFKRPARTIITALILLFCSAYLYFGAVGVAAMRDASNGIFNNSVTYVEGHGLGNEVSVNKNKKGNFEPIESDDTVYDNLDLGKDFSVYFAMGEDFDTALANAVAKSVDAMSQYDVSISLNYMPFGPTKTNKTIFQAEKAKDGALPITVYIDQSLGQDSTFLQALENKGFEANSFHLIPRVLYDNYSSVASSGDKPSFIEKMKDNDCLVYLDKIITVDNGGAVK